jgi:hypothetical protein
MQRTPQLDSTCGGRGHLCHPSRPIPLSSSYPSASTRRRGGSTGRSMILSTRLKWHRLPLPPLCSRPVYVTDFSTERKRATCKPRSRMHAVATRCSGWSGDAGLPHRTTPRFRCQQNPCCLAQCWFCQPRSRPKKTLPLNSFRCSYGECRVGMFGRFEAGSLAVHRESVLSGV